VKWRIFVSKIFNMTSLTVDIRAEELDAAFLKNVRALFKNGRLRITFESDDASALQQLNNLLARRRREGAAYTIPGAAFDTLLDRAEVDESFDVVAALKQFKTP
jgi:hypothetical protein